MLSCATVRAPRTVQRLHGLPMPGLRFESWVGQEPAGGPLCSFLEFFWNFFGFFFFGILEKKFKKNSKKIQKNSEKNSKKKTASPSPSASPSPQALRWLHGYERFLTVMSLHLAKDFARPSLGCANARASNASLLESLQLGERSRWEERPRPFVAGAGKNNGFIFLGGFRLDGEVSRARPL